MRLFDVVGQFLIKPQFLRDINEEYFTCAFEEECLRRRLKHVQSTGKSYVSPAPIAVSSNGPFAQDEFELPEGLLKLKNGKLQAGLGAKLTEVELKRKVLGGCVEYLYLAGFLLEMPTIFGFYLVFGQIVRSIQPNIKKL